MKVIVGVSRIFIGIFFIISGLIKLNDPIGFAFKLEEYFGPTVLDLPFLTPYALGISIFVVVFEVLLGVFLIIGYKPKFTVWSLLLMILFFTFLTFYSAYFDKVKDCGCFGDAMKMTPWQSFWKDVGLLALILIVFTQVKYIKPFFNKFATTIISLLSFIACLWFGYHVLMHLPAKDYRPYKVGANIIDNMTVPEDAPKAVQEFTWTFELKNGEQKEFVTDGSYPNVEGKYVGVEVDIIEEGYEAPIHDFSIEKDGEDLTESILKEDNLILIVAYNLEKAEVNGLKIIKEATDKAIKNGYTVVGLTATGPEEVADYKSVYNLNFDFYFCDETALKTIVRSNPGILKLQNATIKQKLHFNDIDQLELPVVERKPEPKPEPVEVTNVMYFIDDELATKEMVDTIKAELIERMEVVKDSVLLKEMDVTGVDSIIKITLKQ
ncbi:BT_3928 family protein [Pontimicrobium sp. MEBiC01747]